MSTLKIILVHIWYQGPHMGLVLEGSFPLHIASYCSALFRSRCNTHVTTTFALTIQAISRHFSASLQSVTHLSGLSWWLTDAWHTHRSTYRHSVCIRKHLTPCQIWTVNTTTCNMQSYSTNSCLHYTLTCWQTKYNYSMYFPICNSCLSQALLNLSWLEVHKAWLSVD